MIYLWYNLYLIEIDLSQFFRERKASLRTDNPKERDMHPVIKSLLKKVAPYVIAFVALVALFNSTWFVEGLTAVLQIAFGNLIGVLNNLVPLIALAIVLAIVWRIIFPRKNVAQKKKKR